MTAPAASAPTLARGVRSGLIWSTLNNVALRVGSLALGIVLARLLTPEQFGVYAVALSVQAILITLADFGLSADLIRSADFVGRAPTVATLGLITGLVLAVEMAATAEPVAAALGSPDSAAALVVLAATLLLAGAGVVPFAALQRRFDQRSLFLIGIVDFLISTTVTVGLILAGWGVVSLAIGRVAAQCCSLLLQFRLSGVRPRWGLEPTLVPSVLRFGLPVATANLLSWAVLGTDKIVIAALTDPVALGFYVLAFNVSTWPMTAVGQVIRSVALPAFARATGQTRDGSIVAATALTWALALPLGGLLAALAVPLVEVLYGDRWSASAPALVALGIVGAVRVVFDLFASFLLARGASTRVMVIQIVWFLSITTCLIPAVLTWGFLGAAWAHAAVAILVVAPAYALALRSVGCSIRPLLAAALPPLAAAVPAGVVAVVCAQSIALPWLALVSGAAGGAGVYAALLWRWARRVLSRLSNPSTLTIRSTS